LASVVCVRPTSSEVSFYMNISYYNEGGINLQKQPIKYITLEEFVLLVKNNPNIGFYEHLRNLKITDKEQYDKLKKTLPFITPHVEAIGRKLSGDYYDINFRSFTQLMYFDIDDVENVHKEKQRIINQYGDFVSFVCISPSGRGISIIIQIENELTRVNFDMLWLSIRMNEFKDENIDMKATGIGRTMFISSDQDVYYNPNVSLAVDFTMDEKVGNHTNSLGVKFTNYINSHISNSNTITKKKYRSYSINEILNTIVTSTPVDVDNEIVDVREVEDYVSMYIPRIIVDGKKRSTYLIMIHQLFHLNPDLQIDIIYSYIWFINNNFAKPRMEKSQLLRHFNNVVDEIHKTKMVSVNYRTRSIHWNRNCQFLSCIDKMTIAKRLVGLHTRYKNQNSVFEAIDRLGVEGKKITNKAIKEITGKDIKTIRNYRDKPLIDLEVEIKVILEELIPQNPINMCA
jgi:hypothetical protein